MRFTQFFALALPLFITVEAQVAKEAATDATVIPKSPEVAAGSAFEGHDGKTKTDGGGGKTTMFNGKTVPPITELTTATIEERLQNGTWLVEFFSPYCHHCKSFAPTYQTLHEFYYTNDPLPATAQSADPTLNSFTAYYDFHISKVDCVANGDACGAHGIRQYPTFKVFKNGQQSGEEKSGAKSLEDMSAWVEGILSEIKPDSRPVGGPILPRVGDKQVGSPSLPPVDKLEPVAPAVKSALAAPAIPEPKARPTGVPNKDGKSIPLSAEKFQELVTMTQDPWFIKFYTPWCSHCQQLAPNWQEMARQKKGQLNIGEVNCEAEKRLCKEVKVKGYPTMIFFLGGERIEYHGLRGLGDLIEYGDFAAAAAQGVRDVTAAQFEELEKTEEVLFLYVYDHATTSEDFAALERLVMSLIGHAKLVKSSDPALAQRFRVSTWPTMLVSRDGTAMSYDGLSPKDMRDVHRVLDWMKKVWLPIVPELTAANAVDVMRGKILVLGILSRERPEELEIAKREIKNAALEWIDKQEQQFQLELQELRDAKQLRIEEAEDRDDQRALRAAKSIRINREDLQRKPVTFAWIDGVFWERWIKTTYGINVKDGDRVVVNDEANRGYWDNTITGNAIVPSRTSILETLPKLVANPPKIKAKTTHTTMDHFWWTLKRGIIRHPFLNAGIVLVVVIAVSLWVRSKLKSRPGGVRLGEKSNPMDGLLNGGLATQGKVD